MSSRDKHSSGGPAEKAVSEILKVLNARGFGSVWREIVNSSPEAVEGLRGKLVAIVEAFARPSEPDGFRINPVPDGGGTTFAVSGSWVDPKAGLRHLFGAVVTEAGAFTLPQAHYFQIPADVVKVQLYWSQWGWALLHMPPGTDNGRLWVTGELHPDNEKTVGHVSRRG